MKWMWRAALQPRMYTTDRGGDADIEKISKSCVWEFLKMQLNIISNKIFCLLCYFSLNIKTYPKTKKAVLIWIDGKKCSNIFLGLSSTSIHTKQLHFSHNQFVRRWIQKMLSYNRYLYINHNDYLNISVVRLIYKL